MFRLRSLIGLMALLVSWTAQPALAAPEGEFVAPQGGQQERVLASPSLWVSEISGMGMPEPYREESPIAEAIEPTQAAPGRLVLGPLADRMEPFEIVWFNQESAAVLRIYRDGQQHPTLAAARQASAPPGPFIRFWSAARFAELSALPALAKPDRAGLLTLMREVLPRIPMGSTDSAVNEAMEDLMIEKGLNPFSSRQAFVEAREGLAEDPEVQSLLEEIEGRIQQDAPDPEG
jgi:hypothetical protein